MRILVSGGAGFIGSNFVQYLLDHTKDNIVTLDRLTYAGSLDNLGDALDNPRHEFIEGDICDTELVENILSTVDAVANFAAESHVDRSIESAKRFIRTNVEGTQSLLDAAVKADLNRFLQVSTDEVYGEVLVGSVSEHDSLDPRNPYAASKAAADLLVNSYYTTHGLPVVTTRSSNNFGPQQNPEKLIPKFILNAASGNPLPVFGDGTNVREWTYVADNCRAINLVLREGGDGEVYNIGSGHRMTNIAVTRKIIDILGVSPNIINFVSDRAGHDRRYALDTSKIRSLGWEPIHEFEDALRTTIDYYLDE